MSDNLPQTISIPALSNEKGASLPSLPWTLNGQHEQDSNMNGDPRHASRLEGSLRGVLRPQFYLITNGYPTMGDLALKPESIAEDVKNLRTWASRFNPTVIFRQYCDQEGFRRAEDRKIRKALRHSRDHPTLFYIAGHTHRRLGTGIQPSGDELVYLPSDCLESHLPGEYKDISYEEMRQILLRKPRTEALVFINEACYCDNFLQLPYVLEWDGNEMLWKRTEYCDIFPKDSGDVVHLAATGPNEPAVCYRDKGALFTYALYCIDPMEPLSLKTIGKRLRDNVAIISRAAGESTDKLCAQHPKVYASRKMNDPHFFQALGFYYPSDLDSGVRGDSN